MKFNLILLPQATSDVDDIISFLVKKSPTGANTWYQTWLKTCETLKRDADSFGRAPEDADNEFTIQQLIFKTKSGNPYRVIYRILDNTVYVYHVRGAGQDLVSNLGDVP